MQARTMFTSLLVLLVLVTVPGRNKLARRTREEKWAAVKAYHVARGELRAKGQPFTVQQAVCRAASIYQEDFKWDCSRRALTNFIYRWSVEHDMPDGPFLADTPHPRGKPPQRMSDAECEQCIAELLEGYTRNGRRYPFRNLTHAARWGNCETVTECRARYDDGPAGDRQMWRRLRIFDRGLYKLQCPEERLLDAQLKAERVASSAWYLLQPIEFYKRLFFIDCHTIYVNTKAGWSIGHRTLGNPFYFECEEALEGEEEEEEDKDEDGEVIAHEDHVKKVIFYAMVNWHVGPCGFWVCQGSTGIEDRFKVS